MSSFKIPNQLSPTSDNELIKQSLHAPTQKFSSRILYNVPSWSAPSTNTANYKLEVLKSGKIIEIIENLHKKAFWKFGRLLEESDIYMAHPTISRLHAILQYAPKNISLTQHLVEGWYIYDLNSTHGTFVNKQRIPPNVYIRVHVGHMIRLGTSTRLFVLNGPREDEEPESDMSVTEFRTKCHEKHDTVLEKTMVPKTMCKQKDGINWGMSEDANEELDLSHNPYAKWNNQHDIVDDPKRALRTVFEREGATLEYKCDEVSAATFVCRVELPIDDFVGRPIIAEVVHKGRKKDCVIQCAMEACKILDRYGFLRQRNQESRTHKLALNSSDSDDDCFWDRTGDVERRKSRRLKRKVCIPLSYNDLQKQETELNLKLEKVELDIMNHDRIKNKNNKTIAFGKPPIIPNDTKDFDSLMENICDDITDVDKMELRKLRFEQQRIQLEQISVQRLISIAKPELQLENAVDKNIEYVKEKAHSPKLVLGKRNRCIIAHSPTIGKIKSKSISISNRNEQKLKNKIKHGKNIADSNTVNGIKSDPKEHNKTQTIKSYLNNTNNAFVDSGATTSKLQSKKSYKSSWHNPIRNQEEIRQLEEHDSLENYANWLPPENQNGDGYTVLNKKYDY